MKNNYFYDRKTKGSLRLLPDLVIPLGENKTRDVLCNSRVACTRLGYSDRDLTQAIRSGQLPSLMHEKKIKIRSIVIDNFLYNAGYACDKSRDTPLTDDDKELCA